MNFQTLRALLNDIEAHRVAPAEALERLRDWPFEDLGFAKIDHHRALRQGFPEVVFGLGKTPLQIAAIAAALHARGSTVLVTRATQSTLSAVREEIASAAWHEMARIISIGGTDAPHLPGTIGVVCAGTSDLPVAEEAAVTLEIMGASVQRVSDVGVAGLHRLLHHLPLLRRCDALICVAGMEGALPSVVAGLVDIPVIAVPTSVGYGASFGGLAALLGMLNSCANGIAVVNIDNGFGAAAFAAKILQRQETGDRSQETE